MSDPNTVTFLFTDIAGSTRRWEQWPAAMAAALARHDALLAEAIAAHGGRVFKTVGDAFCAAFATPGPALAAALAAQHALAAEDWAAVTPDLPALGVRMAVHAGPAEARGGDFFGSTVNRVARLLAAGHPGQVLLTDVAAELAAEALPAGAGLRPLGRHRLKDLALPIEVFQLLAPGLATDFPPLASLDRLHHNLPVQTSSFVGRVQELAALQARLASSPLVTLSGPGGTGKTRLALQLAAECLDDFADGVFFVDLAPLANPALVPGAAVQALGLPPEAGRAPLETLVDFLRRWPRVLLILDNCEHVLAAAAELAHALLAACPSVRVLATSREVLAVPGEAVWPLAPLAVPEPADGTPDPAALTAYDAVRLFVDRAEASLPGFRVTRANAAAVAHICRRLDGIPLALELAAARVRLFSPADLAKRLDERFRVLTGGSRVALPRHQTLRACLDWSYDLLPEEERRVLERLGVFAGHIPFDAAERVCAGGTVDDLVAMDALMGLEAKSLVVGDHGGERSAVRLLETVRAYARERLAESGDEAATRARHLAWCHAFAREAEPQVDAPSFGEWFVRFTRMSDDITGALTWGLANDDPVRARQAIETALALVHFLGHDPGKPFTYRHFAQAIAPAFRIGDPTLLAQVLYRAGAFDHLVSQIGATLPESPGMGFHCRLGQAILAGDDTVPDHFRSLGLQREEAWILQDTAILLAYEGGDIAGARRLAERSLAIKRAVAPRWDVAIGLNVLGELHRQEGDHARAADLFEQSLGGSEVIPGPPGHRMWTFANLAFCQMHLGQPLSAVGNATSALRIPFEMEDWRATASFLPICACAHAHAGDGRAAARLYGAADAAYRYYGGSLGERRSIAGLLGPTDWDDIARGEALGRTLLTPGTWAALHAEGAAMSVDDAIACALAAGGQGTEGES